MSKTKVAQKPPKKLPLHLGDAAIQQVRDFSSNAIPRARQQKMPVGDVALALDFLQRLKWRRSDDENRAWIDSETISDRLHALRALIHLRQELADGDRLGVSEHEWDAFIADLLEYFTVRAELAGQPSTWREIRYMVSVDRRALPSTPAPKAVA